MVPVLVERAAVRHPGSGPSHTSCAGQWEVNKSKKEQVADVRVKVLQYCRQTDNSDMSRFCHDRVRRAIVERVQPTTEPPIPVDLDAAHALGVTDASGTLHTQGEPRRIFDLASVSKPLAALGVLVAVERGLVDLDEPAGPEGATVRHLLAHTAGYPFEGEETVGAVGARRIYSNTGFEVLAAHVEEATGHDFPDWMEQTVVQGLDLVDLEVDGSPAAGYRSTVDDLLVIGRELLTPTLLSAEDPQSLLLPVDAYFAGRPILILKAGPEKKVRNGMAVSVPQAADGQYRVYGESGAFLALGQVKNGRLTTIKSFFEV